MSPELREALWWALFAALSMMAFALVLTTLALRSLDTWSAEEEDLMT